MQITFHDNIMHLTRLPLKKGTRARDVSVRDSDLTRILPLKQPACWKGEFI